ncbi:MAG TPA: M23 family metallopeptidase, partial [Candidatus Limnocylindrales bacterium]|nr:M23 family metallopeptidase [Candidatus Limnocylindrales bacterium]
PSAGPTAAAEAVSTARALASPDGGVASAAPLPSGLPSGYQWPLDHGRITSWFGPLPSQPYLVNGKSFHDGIDIASFCGDHVLAAHDGTVLVAGRHVDKWFGWVGGYDAHVARLDAKNLWGSLPIVVIVDDGNGYRSIYMHLGLAAVKAGDHVRAGQLIGYEGRTGNATGCHLHYSLFDPSDTAVFETSPAYVTRYALPAAEVARIDPLLVFPPMATVSVTWGWGARD